MCDEQDDIDHLLTPSHVREEKGGSSGNDGALSMAGSWLASLGHGYTLFIAIDDIACEVEELLEQVLLHDKIISAPRELLSR